MTSKNVKKSMAVTSVLLAVVLLIPPGLVNAQTTPGDIQDETEVPYTLANITHSFDIMEEYVIYDVNKTMTFDLASAVQNPNISLLDIRIALDFADHNNKIMNAVVGPTGQVNELQTRDEQISHAINELENGKFSALFGESGPVGNVNDVIPTSYVSVQTPIISAFGVNEYNHIHETRRGDNNPLACGGSFSKPHPPAVHTRTGSFTTESAAISDLTSDGYHQVPSYASLNYPDDYAKVIDAYNCNNGPFRTQSIVFYDDDDRDYKHSNHDVEPNPEILSYFWPKLWWGSYVQWWHNNF